MIHDFKKFPELTNEQMQDLYFLSPHKQILESFDAEVVKVIDGDTVKVRWRERDFDFPVRMLRVNAPEMNEEGGKEAKEYLKNHLLGQRVLFEIDPDNRVGKYGRILAEFILNGLNFNDEMVNMGHATELINLQDRLLSMDKLLPNPFKEAN